MSVIVAVVCFYLLVIIGFLVYRNHLMSPITRILKDTYFSYMTYRRCKTCLGLIIVHDKQDSGFVYEEFLPALKTYSESPIGKSLVTIPTNKDKIMNKIKRRNKNKTYLVVFSPNYLRAQFSDVSIINILSVMKDAKNTVYVFVDIGPYDSIYAFLKEQRDLRNSVVWDEPQLWNKFSTLVDLKKIDQLVKDNKNLKHVFDTNLPEYTKTQSVMLPESKETFFNEFATDALSGHLFRNGNNGIYYQFK